MGAPTVLIIIPALNEVATIGLVLDEIPLDELRRTGYEPRTLVVDNGSSDGTRQVALEKGAEVVDEPRRGKGMAMRRAFREASADYVFMLDADATYPPFHIPAMLHVLENDHDVVIGSRLAGTRAPGSISSLNVIGNRLLTWMACALYGIKTSDLCTGYWGFRGKALAQLQLSAQGFNLEAELFAEVARHGLRLGELPIHYRRRPTPTKLRSLRDGARIVRTLLGKRF
ncbi:MAG: glycosyltransferase [Chloroflexi bacterium]|nr:glycosyltransferase [Chloroflexota bacterium]